MKLFLSDLASTVESVETLASALASAEDQVEIWLADDVGPSLCCLRNGDNALLMYLRSEGDSGFCSQNERAGDHRVSFSLSNGQVDSYPADRIVAFATAKQAMVHFYLKQQMDLVINWMKT